MKTTTAAELTKNIRKAKVGDTIIVPMGMIFPHAVKLEKVYTDDDGQIIGVGPAVEKEGCSTWRLGEQTGVCLGWK